VRHAAVTVPAGVDNGSRLRVTGEGERVYADIPPGDLYVTVHVEPHPFYERVAQNLLTKVSITVFTAMLGGQVDVQLLGGGSVKVTVPQGVQPGQRLRITGHGMPILNQPGKRGDLIVALDLTTPDLSAEQRALIQKVVDMSKVDEKLRSSKLP
ncbi:MAG: hypothetical protein EOO77_33555, partial [Oxalobacteraceae bacterium]